MEPVRFFGAAHPFSNFYPCTVATATGTATTSEAAFQAAKFATTDPAYAAQVLAAPTGRDAKRLGGSRKHPIDPAWPERRVDAMRAVLRAKFNPQVNPELVAALRATGTQPLVEASPYDSFWGCGRTGKGANMLGRLLEELRAQTEND